MKVSVMLSAAFAALAVAAPNPEAPSDEVVARGLELVKKETSCYDCINNCKTVGGLGEAACKIVICAIQCVLVDTNPPSN